MGSAGRQKGRKMSRRYTAGEIRDMLTANLESICSTYWDGWVLVGKKAMMTPSKKGGDKKPTSSFQVEMAGQHRGRWFRHSQQVGGWPLELLFYGQTGRVPRKGNKEDARDAFARAKAFLGIEEGRGETEQERRDREERQRRESEDRRRREAAEDAERRRRAAERSLTAAEICRDMLPIAGTHAEAYLVARGIPPVSQWPWDPNGTLGFVPALDYELDPSFGDLPALVARVQDPFDDTIAVWQIYLDPKAAKKHSGVPNAKLGRGPAAGGTCRLGGAGARIGIGEGVESCLGNLFLESWRMPIWAGLSTSGVSGFQPPYQVERVDIYPDGDRAVMHVRRDRAAVDRGSVHDPPGLTAARKLADRLRPLGLLGVVNTCLIDEDGLDRWNAWCRRERSR